MITLTDVYKNFGDVVAVDGLSCTAPQAMITGLLGPNGAGKTTALRCIYGLTQPSRGTIDVDGFSVRDALIEVRRRLGIFTDKFGLYDRLSAREQLVYFARLNGVAEKDIPDRLDRVSRLLDMADILDRRTEGFSQGQRMKVGLARALVHEPGNLVLDEPTRGLDVMSTRNLRSLLRELRSDGVTIIFSSHVMQEVAALCDRVVVMRAGKACAEGTPDQLCEQAGESDLEEAFITLIGTAEGIAA